MGTPAYMPPEQARGERVDERADVYALGAILFHVLAGRPPITGRTTADVFAKLLDGPPPSLADVQPDVPPDLLTLVAKAMASSPSARYPSARELADDLRRFQTGQLVGAHQYSLGELLRRWVRRHRTAITVAAVALAVLFAGGAFAVHRIIRAQQIAEEQRALAEREGQGAKASRGQVEDLVDYMLVDLRDKLEPLGRVDLLGDVAKKAAAYFDDRPGATESELRKRALALHNLGSVTYAQGDVAGAHELYRRSLVDAQRLVAHNPSEENFESLARAQADMASMLQAQGDSEGALERSRAALAIAEMLSARSPSEPLRKRAVAARQVALADLLHLTRRSDEARTHAEAARSLLLSLASADDAANAGVQEELGDAEYKLATIAYLHGTYGDALERYRAAARAYATADAARPSAQLQLRLAKTHNGMGDARYASERPVTRALAEYREAARIVEQLAARDPTNILLLRNLSTYQSKVCMALTDTEDLNDALVACKAAVSVLEPAAAMAKTDIGVQSVLASAHERLAELLDLLKDTEGALTSARIAVAMCERLVRLDPTNTTVQRRLFSTLLTLGDALRSARKPAEAVPVLQSSLEIAKQLLEKVPQSGNAKIDVADAHLRLGNALAAQKDAAAAAVEYRASLALRQELAAADPTSVRFERAIMATHVQVAEGLLEAGDREGARSASVLALAAIDQLMTKARSEDDRAELRAQAAEVKALLARCCTSRKK